MEKKLAVVALGGNALLRGDQAGTIDEQEQNTTETLENLVFLIPCYHSWKWASGRKHSDEK
jgi:carbamate kinase